MGNMEYIKATFGVLDQCAEEIFQSGNAIKAIGDDFPKPADPEWFTPYEYIRNSLGKLQTATTAIGNDFTIFAAKLSAVNGNYKTAEAYLEGSIAADNGEGSGDDGTGSDTGGNGGDGTYITSPPEFADSDDLDENGFIRYYHDDYSNGMFAGGMNGGILHMKDGEALGLETDNLKPTGESDGFLYEHSDMTIASGGRGVRYSYGEYGDSEACKAYFAEAHGYGEWQVTAKDGLTATVGMGASLLDVTGSGKAEWNLGGIEGDFHGEYDAKFLAADASASFTCGPNGVKAEAGAEAVLVSVSGKAGVDIAGVDVNVSGQVGVGLGARADIGVHDGKLKVELGAYVGIGGDISFEVDFSKYTQPINQAVDGVVDWFKSWW